MLASERGDADEDRVLPEQGFVKHSQSYFSISDITSHFQISSGSANEATTDRSLSEEVNKARLEIMKIYWEDCSSKNLSEERNGCLEVEFKCEEVFKQQLTTL